MADIRLTEAQRAAVEDRGGTLLVSAAAGSGKTKVLVERLLSRVCDPADPRDISEFLIITYTRAAAAELRGRISAELSERLARDPGNRHLRRQLSLIVRTEISTVHAFCANLIRAYAHLLDLPSDFRVAEESESAALLSRALDETLEESYAEIGGDGELRALVDLFGSGRDDRGVAQAVLALRRAAQCRLDPEKWIDGCRESLKFSDTADAAETPWGAYLLERLRAFAEGQAAAMARAAEEMRGDEAAEKAYLPAFEETIRALSALREASSWDGALAALPGSLPRLKPIRGEDGAADRERWKEIRARCADGLKEQREIFYGPSAEVLSDLRDSSQALLGAFALLGRAEKRFRAEKRRRRMLDFSDLEHEAVRLLTDRSTGAPTAAAREIAARYCEIMVDEYQDSNEVQDCIFRAVSKDGGNRFLVGDVKQSIYRFRLADPTIFLEKYRTYRDAREAAPGEPRKILLSENFRSRPELLGAVNHVFRTVMSERVGDLRYGDDEALRPGLTFPDAPGPRVELHCLETGAGDVRTESEAELVAARIAGLLAGDGEIADGGAFRRARPEDVVILLRSVSSAAPDYLAALRARGIPCVCDRGESVLDTAEAEVVLALLQTIDNPRQDIPLSAVLSSPLFAFSADELGAVRAGRRDGDFYDALRAAAGENPKIPAFLKTLAGLREAAKWETAPELLREAYRVTDAEAVYGAMADGAARLESLHALLELAAASGKRTAAQLTGYLLSLREQGTAVPAPGTAAAGGAVRILSVHKSKGLEFPVVFLADLARRFNQEDLREQVLTHPSLFAGGNAIDREHGIRYPTIAKKAISLKLRQESVSEELRVLYVAMTRAKDMLILSYASRYLESELHAAADWGVPADPTEAERARCPGAWVLAAATDLPEAAALRELSGASGGTVSAGGPWKIVLHRAEERLPAEPERPAHGAGPSAPQALPDEGTLAALLAYRYPCEAACRVPSKLTATQLKGRAVDEEAADGSAVPDRPRQRPLRRPDFAEARTGLTGAERGTANHLFLQFARYEACTTPEGVDAEARRLAGLEFLTAPQADAVRRGEIARLFSSPLGQRLRRAEKVTREFKFSLLTDAGAYEPAAAGEKLLLQGVVDCFFEEDGALTVLDFKTDAVRPDGEAARAETYRAQITAYAAALGRICGKRVRERILYFLATGTAVSI